MIDYSPIVSRTIWLVTSKQEPLYCPHFESLESPDQKRNQTRLLSKSYLSCLKFKHPTVSHSQYSLNMYQCHQSPHTDCLRTLPTTASGSAAMFYYRTAFTQMSDCLRGSTTCLPPSLLKINPRCATLGCHGDASEKGGRAEVNVLHVGTKT